MPGPYNCLTEDEVVWYNLISRGWKKDIARGVPVDGHYTIHVPASPFDREDHTVIVPPGVDYGLITVVVTAMRNN